MVTEQEKKIVLSRLSTMPLDLELSLGNMGSFDRNKLIEEVEANSKVGEMVVEVYMTYLRSYKKTVD